MDTTSFLRKTQELCLQGELPIIVVDVSLAPCFVPQDLVENNIININIHPKAVTDFRLWEDVLKFKSCFDSKVYTLEIPVKAITDVIGGGDSCE